MSSGPAFQFQTGAIKSKQLVLFHDNLYTGFNSKLVRLKVSADGYDEEDPLSFNSKLVRLKGIFAHNIKLASSAVSIPNWCD